MPQCRLDVQPSAEERTNEPRPQVRRTSQTPVYGIGAASRLTGIPIWTLRWIEKHQLVRPKRTSGNHRMFSEEDVRRLERIRGLLEEKVNLAGIRVMLRSAEARARA